MENAVGAARPKHGQETMPKRFYLDPDVYRQEKSRASASVAMPSRFLAERTPGALATLAIG